MAPMRVVGIDPASGDHQCALLQQGTRKATYRNFAVADKELKQLVEWIESEQVTIVAIESHGGFCTPLERIRRANGIPFYSFDSYRVTRHHAYRLPPRISPLLISTTVCTPSRVMSASRPSDEISRG